MASKKCANFQWHTGNELYFSVAHREFTHLYSYPNKTCDQELSKNKTSPSQGSTSRTGAVAVSAVPVSRPDSKTRDRSGNAGNWSETPETARFPVPGLHREITSRREVKPWSQHETTRVVSIAANGARNLLWKLLYPTQASAHGSSAFPSHVSPRCSRRHRFLDTKSFLSLTI